MSFSVFDIVDPLIIGQLHEELWSELVPDAGSCDSAQGELIRTTGRISSEGFQNGNNNWIYEKFHLNEQGYPKDYLDLDEIENDDMEEPPNVMLCTTTQEQLDNATLFDELLNFVKYWFNEHPLDEWDEKFQSKLQNALEMARPAVPIGVISNGHWADYTRTNGVLYNDGWGGWDDENSDFANAQVVYWIYRNPDLVDLNNKPLGKSVAHIFNK